MSNIVPTRPRQMMQRRSFAIVASQYNPEFVRGLIDGAKEELKIIAPSVSVSVYEVPGAFEIPLLVSEVVARGGLDAVIALGVIIEGETRHAEFIGRSVTDALLRQSIELRVPIIHEVLIVRDEQQARARCLGTESNRGVEAARSAVRMAQIFGEFRAR